ncbi:MAG: ABC transporter permease [Oscillospiraceae bacterium]|nr:ABC transporter permease [Oscillospiraceae bacterium]
MRRIKAIFIKQAKDMLKNPIALLPFIIFPVIALIMTELVAKGNEDIPDNMFVTMMSAIFAGFGMLQSSAAIIAEDIEKKSLRFLIMAGVKPYEYLLGIGGFLLFAGVVVSASFGLIGGFTSTDFLKFFTVMIISISSSVTLGATIGLMSKNQQAAAGASVPIAVILGFTPMIANFNETVEKAAGILYTQQLNVIVNDFSANFIKAIVIMGINITVLAVLFIIAYRKKGLKA